MFPDQWASQPPKVTVPGTQTTATVQNLKPFSAYQMRIIAENRLGPSEPSEMIQVNTLEEVPSGSPQDIRAEAKSSTELVVTWEPPPRDLWNGNLLGYYVWYQQVLAETPTTAASLPTTSQNSNFKTVEMRPHLGGETTLQGLEKYSTYSIVVQAYNSRGSGPSSDPVSSRTMEDGMVQGDRVREFVLMLFCFSSEFATRKCPMFGVKFAKYSCVLGTSFAGRPEWDNSRI